MIVVVGNPAWRAVEPAGPAGRTCGIALAAAQRGARVELVGRVGDDHAGDALVLGLARAGVGHAALLRDPARATPIVPPMPEPDDAAEPAPASAPATPRAAVGPSPVLEPADVSLGLQYLTTFGVLVVVDDVPPATQAVAIEAAAFAGARLVVLVAPAAALPSELPDDTTALAAPDVDDEGAFAVLVGGYAAALDAGVPAAEAFAAATSDSGWEELGASA